MQNYDDDMTKEIEMQKQLLTKQKKHLTKQEIKLKRKQ